MIMERFKKISIVVIICCVLIALFIFVNEVTHEDNEVLTEQNNSMDKLKKVVIDPGHGGHDPGAISPNDKLEEKNVVLDISLRLKELLEKEGFKVYMTREDDKHISLNDRCDIANEIEAAAFVSIHADAHAKGDIEGIQVLYSPEGSRDNKTFATIMKNSLIKELNTSDQGIIERTKSIVLRDTKMPAISLGVGFLTNPREEKLLGQEDYKQKCAEGAYNGILEYFSSSAKDK